VCEQPCGARKAGGHQSKEKRGRERGVEHSWCLASYHANTQAKSCNIVEKVIAEFPVQRACWCKGTVQKIFKFMNMDLITKFSKDNGKISVTMPKNIT
jgi:hypothetical protein